MDVNPVKEKKLTNVRSVQADEKVFLFAPRLLSLEEAIGYVSGALHTDALMLSPFQPQS